jgi:hypothetical protein
MKRTLLIAAKILVSLVLLSYLITNKTDLREIENRVRSGDLLMLAAAVTCYTLVLLISSWRWCVLLRAQGFPAPLRQLSASYLVATFFNNFLPSNIGGDVIRVRDGTQLTGSTTASLAIVAIDRILGFGALYFLAACAYTLGGPQTRQLAGALPILIGLGLFFAALAYIFFRPGTARRLMALTRLNNIPWARERFETIQSAVHVYRSQMMSVWVAFGASLTLQTLLVLYYFAVARALRIPLPLIVCFLMIPLSSLVQSVPISFNGWGIREGLFIVYFAQFGLGRESALAFSLLGAGLTVVLSLSGAVVWTARGLTADSSSSSNAA